MSLAGSLDAPLEGRDFFSLLSELSTGRSIDVPAWAMAHGRSERYASTYYTNSSLVYRLLRPYRAAICLQAIEKDGYVLIWSAMRAAPAYWTPEIPGTLDEASLERLRALGYLR